jgi:hypothetical protein
MARWIAEEALDATDPAGVTTKVLVRVAAPYKVGPDEWACGVEVAGLHGALPDIHGLSSLQALCLAATLARRLLTYFIEDGGQLRDCATKQLFDIDACFSGVGASRPAPNSPTP